MENDIEYEYMSDIDESRILEASREMLAKDMKCHRIGKIVAFNSATLTCDVDLFDKMTHFGQAESYVTIPDLPLIIPATNSKHITFGDIVGSECIVHFNDVDIDNWFETGETYIPNSRRKHNLSDGFVELRPFNKTAVFTYYTNGIEIKNGNSLIHINDDGSIEITNGSGVISMSGTTINITGDVNVSGDVKAGTVSLKNHIHSGVTSGSSNSGKPVV